MNRRASQIALTFLVLLLSACEKSEQPVPVTMVIGSWYGFYPFYYAQEQGLDIENGIRLKILEPTNIANLRRSYLRAEVDFIATSMLEYTNAVRLNNSFQKPIIISDYSNGGDVVIAKSSIESVEALKGKRIAVPSQGIGEYFLSLVFDDIEPMKHFQQVNLAETECDNSFATDKIDACITYPPISTYLLAKHDVHALQTSSAHPGRIFDVVWPSADVPIETQEKLKKIWFSIIDNIQEDPQAFYQFVAKIASVSTDSVEQAMQGIVVINQQEHTKLLNQGKALGLDLTTACKVASGENCDRFESTFNGQH